jgi:hypothetical protein
MNVLQALKWTILIPFMRILLSILIQESHPHQRAVLIIVLVILPWRCPINYLLLILLVFLIARMILFFPIPMTFGNRPSIAIPPYVISFSRRNRTINPSCRHHHHENPNSNNRTANITDKGKED